MKNRSNEKSHPCSPHHIPWSWLLNDFPILIASSDNRDRLAEIRNFPHIGCLEGAVKGTPSGVGDAGNQIHILHAMILLHGFQDIETPQPSRASVAGNTGRGGSNKEKKCTLRAGPGGFLWASPVTFGGWIICAVLILLSLAASGDASNPDGQHGQKWGHDRAIRRHEAILLDRSPPPVPAHGNLRKRQDDGSGSDQSSPSSSLERPSFASTAAAVDETETARPSLVGPSDEKSSTTKESNPSPSSDPDIPIEAGPLPKPFDGGFGTNYTQQSCPTFLRSMLNNDTFSACHPLSLLLQVCNPNR